MKSVELHTEPISKNWLFPVNNSHFRTSNSETQVEKIPPSATRPRDQSTHYSIDFWYNYS